MNRDYFYGVSIVIPQYNGLTMLQACITSIEKAARYYTQQLDSVQKVAVELIVVDNASSDGSPRWFSDYCQQDRAPLIPRLIAHSENLGFAAAVNAGIRSAKSDYVILLNNDTLVRMEFIAELLECISSDQRIFSASAQMLIYHQPHLIDDAGDIYCLMGWALQRGHGKPAFRYEKSCRIFSSCGGAAIYRRSALEALGYFDENFFAYLEDVDLGYRSLIHGWYNVYCPKAKVLHIGSASSGGHSNPFKVHLSSRNSIYVIYKNMPLLFLLIHFPFLLLGFLIKYLYFTKDGFRKDFEKGYQDAFASLHRIEKIPFRWKLLPNYLYIEWILLLNTLKAFVWKVQRAWAKLRQS